MQHPPLHIFDEVEAPAVLGVDLVLAAELDNLTVHVGQLRQLTTERDKQRRVHVWKTVTRMLSRNAPAHLLVHAKVD